MRSVTRRLCRAVLLLLSALFVAHAQHEQIASLSKRRRLLLGSHHLRQLVSWQEDAPAPFNGDGNGLRLYSVALAPGRDASGGMLPPLAAPSLPPAPPLETPTPSEASPMAIAPSPSAGGSVSGSPEQLLASPPAGAPTDTFDLPPAPESLSAPATAPSPMLLPQPQAVPPDAAPLPAPSPEVAVVAMQPSPVVQTEAVPSPLLSPLAPAAPLDSPQPSPLPDTAPFQGAEPPPSPPHAALPSPLLQAVRSDSAELSPAPVSLPVAAGCPDQQEVLALHNRLRARHGVDALAPDEALQQQATGYARQLAEERGCNLEHSELTERPGQGENLYSYWNAGGVDEACAEAVQLWYNELAQYDYNNVSQALSNLRPVGHFTQLLWAGSTRLGCGMARAVTAEGYACKVVACRYSPQGNLLSEALFASNVPPPRDGGSCPDVDATLAAVNARRAAHGTDALVWSNGLAADTTAAARHVAFENQCGEDGFVQAQLPSDVGQTAFYSAAGGALLKDTCAGAVLQWYGQAPLYNFDDPGANLAEGAPITHDFMQLVWASAGAVGCGIAVGNHTGLNRTCEVAVCRFSTAVVRETEQLAAYVQPPLPPAGTCVDAADVLSQHNQYRAQHGAPPLLWDPALEASASAWSAHLATHGCPAAASPASVRGLAGENVYTFAPASQGGEDELDGRCGGAVDSWYREASGYRFGAEALDAQDPAAVGHFTQVVWRGSTSLGCATATGVSNAGLPCQVTTCHYGPAGNTWASTEMAANVGRPEVPRGACDAQATAAAANLYRSQHGAGEVAWSEALVADAQWVAKALADSGNQCQIGLRAAAAEVAGETLFNASLALPMQVDDGGSCEDAFGNWYRTGIGLPWNDLEQVAVDSLPVRNFLQLLWAPSTALGCAYAAGIDPLGAMCMVVACQWAAPAPRVEAPAIVASVQPLAPSGSCSDTSALSALVSDLRAAHGVPPLSWSPLLATEADAVAAQQAADGCMLAPTPADQRAGHGETLYGFASNAGVNASCTSAVSHWYEGAASYNYGDVAASIEDFATIGEFTQLVWASTSEVGCGVATGTSRSGWPCKVVACRYNPAGNINSVEQFENNVLPPLARRRVL